MIVFRWFDSGTIRSVFRDDYKIGTIRPVEGGFSFHPLFARKGTEVFKSMKDCEDSIK